MRKSRNVSTKLLAGLTASLLMFCVPVVAQASTTPTKSATVAVQAASQAKVTTKQLKAKIVSVSYNEDTLNFSYKIQFTNTSSEKITKAKIRTVSSLGEDVVRDKTVTLNLAAGKSKTVTVSLGKIVDNPGKENCSVKVQKIWCEEKPSAKQLKASLVKVSYNENTMNFSYKIQFTNNSSVKITKAKIRTVSSLGEDVVRDKTITLNLAAGKSKTVTVSLGKIVDNPGKENCSVKVQKIYY